jgi:hypothetical protein
MPGQPFDMPTPEAADEVAEGRSWWKVCCGGCCLGIIVLAFVAWAVVRAAAGPGPQSVKTLPESFPSSFTPFRAEEATAITYYPAASQSGVGKIVTGPLGWIARSMGNDTASSTGLASVTNALTQQFRRLEGRDTVVVRWENLRATRTKAGATPNNTDPIVFYAGQLRQSGIPALMRCDVAEKDCLANGTTIQMTGSNGSYNFSLLMTDDPAKAGVDHLTISLDYPVTK